MNVLLEWWSIKSKLDSAWERLWDRLNKYSMASYWVCEDVKEWSEFIKGTYKTNFQTDHDQWDGFL